MIAVLPTALVLVGCASPIMMSDANGDTARRLTCRAKVDCPQQAAQLCPGGYAIEEGNLGVIGTLTDLTVSCR